MSFSFSRDRIEELKNTEPLQNNSDEFGPPRRPGQPLQSHDWGYSRTEEKKDQTSNDNNKGVVVANEKKQREEEEEKEHHHLISMDDTPTMEDFFKHIDGLKSDLNDINTMIDQVDELHTSILSSFNEQKYKQITDTLEQLKKSIRNKNQYLKQRLQELEDKNSQVPISDLQMRKTQIAAVRKRFLDSIQRYQDVERSYQSKYRQQMERQVKIVKPDVTQEEMDDLIDSDEPTQIFTQSLIGTSKHAQAKDVLSQVQSRHDDIKHIEKTIVELHQLFMDMSLMVEKQGYDLEKVSSYVGIVKVNLEEGKTFLSKALQNAKATRAKKWYCFFICIMICIMIGLLIWWYGFDHTGLRIQSYVVSQ